MAKNVEMDKVIYKKEYLKSKDKSFINIKEKKKH